MPDNDDRSSTIVLSVESPADRERTAWFIAALERAGVRFSAEPFDSRRLILFITKVAR